MSAHAPTKVKLDRTQWIRLIIVGLFVAFAVYRTVPDVIRVGFPLGTFDYVTDEAGVVVRAPLHARQGDDLIAVGDRVRIDRIKPFDRKPGLAGLPYTRDNFDRALPIERNGHERVLHLHAVKESPAERVIAVLRILLFLTIVCFGALLVIVKPTVATWALFAYCVGSDAPTTVTDALFDVPYREWQAFAGDLLRGTTAGSLALFAVCLFIERDRLERQLAYGFAVAALALGYGYAKVSADLTYAGRSSLALAHQLADVSTIITVATTLVFIAAVIRARGGERQRAGWIALTFGIAGAARIASDQLFPGHLSYWQNGVLLAFAPVPVIVVWIAVVRQHFFDVDFVVSRALVYAALSAAIIGSIGALEETLSYIFYNNTDIATGFIILISMGVGATFGRITEFMRMLADRFIFRERRAQRIALERMAANMLEAPSDEMLFASLLHDPPSIMELSFSAIMRRTEDGGFTLFGEYQWPAEYDRHIAPTHDLLTALASGRDFSAVVDLKSAHVKALFPNDRLTFIAPIYLERSIEAIVLYGRSEVGIDIDPEERGLLTRIMTNASIALNAIELGRYRRRGAVAV